MFHQEIESRKIEGFILIFIYAVPMSIMVRRRIWQLHSLNQLMLDDAFLVGMNLLARFIYSPLFPFC
jgi:hypothetical protein